MCSIITGHIVDQNLWFHHIRSLMNHLVPQCFPLPLLDAILCWKTVVVFLITYLLITENRWNYNGMTSSIAISFNFLQSTL